MDGLEGLFTPREEDLALTSHVFGEEGDALSVKVFASEAATTDCKFLRSVRDKNQLEKRKKESADD